MKTLKTIILGLIAVITFGAASAKSNPTAAEKFSVNYALTSYVNALTLGQNGAVSNVLDNDFKFTMLNGKSMVSWNKDQMLESLKTTADIKQDCKSTVTISESNSNITVAKVTLEYPGFTRTNYVTVASTTDGWKITSIYSTFKS